nr:2185_t:CDS:2 [Entrophospora candida]
MEEYLDNMKLSEQKKNLIDKSLAKFVSCCGIQFGVVENPFFIDFVKNLKPSYNLPSRIKLKETLVEEEVAIINVKIINELEKTNNLTLTIDGWTNPLGKSIYNFVIQTPTKKEYLWKLNDYSLESHTGNFLAEQIDQVIQQIGNKRFGAIIVTYFEKSHQSNALLHEGIKNLNILGGGLKSGCKTRWSTYYDCTSSILRLESCFNWIIYEHSDVITNNDVKNLLRSRYFFDDIQLISTILKPIKEAVTFLEAKNTTLADCFLQICKIGASIKKLSDNNQVNKLPDEIDEDYGENYNSDSDHEDIEIQDNRIDHQLSIEDVVSLDDPIFNNSNSE